MAQGDKLIKLEGLKEVYHTLDGDVSGLKATTADMQLDIYGDNLMENSSALVRNGGARWTYSKGSFSIQRSSTTVTNSAIMFCQIPQTVVGREFICRIRTSGSKSKSNNISVSGWSEAPTAYDDESHQVESYQTIIISAESYAGATNTTFHFTADDAVEWLAVLVFCTTSQDTMLSGTVEFYAADDTGMMMDVEQSKSAADMLAYEKPYEKQLVGSKRLGSSNGQTVANANFNCYKIHVDGGDIVTIQSTWPVTTSSSNSGAMIAFYRTAYEDLPSSGSTEDLMMTGKAYKKSDEGTRFTETYIAPMATQCALVCGAKSADVTVTKATVYGTEYIKADIAAAAANADAALAAAVAERKNDYLNVGHDVLSAFSNIMCCGDSLTASVVYTGGNASDGFVTRAAYRRYPQILAAKTGAAVTHRALGGYSATEWWDAYKNYITEQENQLAIIYLGTNGGLTDTLDTDAVGDDPANYADTNTGSYCKIVRSFQIVGARVLLVHVCNRVDDYADRNAVIDKIAERFGVAVVDVPYMADDKYHLYPDGTGKNTLHYNDLGYAAWTESLIRNVGALDNTMMARLIPV